MNWNKKDIIRIMLLLCGVVLFAYILFNFDKVSHLFSWLVNILMPFVIGFAIAFVVNVPMKGFEKVLFKNENSRLYKMKRPVCLILSFLCIIAAFAFAITMVIPEMSRTVTAFAEKLPAAMDDIQNKAIKIMKDQPDIVDKIKRIDINWDALVTNLMDLVKNGGSSVLSSTFSIASSVVGAVVDVLVGLFFACYILAQKETLEKQVKGILYAVFKERKADRFIQTCVLADRTFSKFISGQCLEACILGLMFFITMTVFRIPYALTVSILIAVFALIPVLGAFVGCFAGTIMILVDDPKKAVAFLIIFIVLQQIEGNLIYPHVVGGSVGLPSIWVLVAVMVGGDLMGVLGMLIFVPLFSVLYVLSEEYVVKCLKAKHISWKKYNLACEIPEGRWDGRLDEQESAKQSKVKTEDGGDASGVSRAASDLDATGTTLNSDATGTTLNSDATGNDSNTDIADTDLKSDSAESGENVSGVKRSRKRKR